MPEMLTIAPAAKKLTEINPDIHIGEATLRNWQKENCFHSVFAGRRILISWESLVAFLSGEKRGRSYVKK